MDFFFDYNSDRVFIKGVNDLATTNPELLKEWDYEKNKITPDNIMFNSTKKVWWRCSLGHSYDMGPGRRTGRQKCGCPYCSVPAKRVLKGFNDLQFKYPEIAREWHQNKNGTLKPDQVLCGSQKKVWWLGKCGHEFEQGINQRVRGAGCPYCSHQKLLKGFNDLATTNPEILKEWDYDKNAVLPTEIGVGAHKKIWWKCPFGHSYQAYPSNRCGKIHSGCPICDKENHTSFPEQSLYFYIKKYFPDAINSDTSEIGMELDVYLPSKRTAIEYDGAQWHKNKNREKRKNDLCKDNGIFLIRIREEGLDLYDSCYCLARKDKRSHDSLSEVIKTVIHKIDDSVSADINVDRDSALIYENYIVTRKENNLKSRYPEIAAEWHPEKNGELKADMVSPMGGKKVWWLGRCGHEWCMPVQNRTYQGCGCPICSGKLIASGINDLLKVYPELCEEWEYRKNEEIGLFPDKVGAHSDKKAWWKCKKCGNVWQSKIDSRTRMKAGCPLCGVKASASAKFKPVKCIETGVVYGSLKEAEEKTGINKMCIGNVCKGKQKTAGKLHWEYSL